MRHTPRLAVALALFLAACSEAPQAPVQTVEEPQTQAPEGQTAGPASLDAAAIAENNRGVGLMGRFGDLPRLQANLTLYQAGAPCRAPWLDQDPIFYPPPPARGPMQEYPTRAAY